MSVVHTLQRYTPIWLQNLALSGAGYQMHRFRYSRHFRRRLGELEETAMASEEQLFEIQRNRLFERVEWARRSVPRYLDTPPPSTAKDPQQAIRETLDSVAPFERSEYVKAPLHFVGRDRPRSKLIKNSTSGTTGTALDLWHTREALAEEYAIVWRMYRSQGIGLFDPRLTFGGNVVIPFDVDEPPFWRVNHYGHQTLFSSYHMKPENMGIYVTEIHKMKARWVQGYPSSLYLMARALLDSGRPLPRGRLAGVFTSSERLLAHQRDVIGAAFNAPVVNRYGMSEFAASMTSCAEGRLHVDMEFCIVEVEPLETDDGAVRGSLVVTGLAPDAIPFFRYRVGEVGTLCATPCPCGRPGATFYDVEGRQDDFVMTPDGRLVGRLDHIFKGHTEIAEAQILQSDQHSIRVLVVPRLDYDESSERRLLAAIRERLGREIDVSIERVKQIPRESNGKFRAVKSSVGNVRAAGGSVRLT